MNARILIIDDERLVRSALRRVLGRVYGQEAILEADGTISARGVIAAQLSNDDQLVVISDHDMPDGKGLDYLVELSQRLGDRLVGRILLTGGNRELREEVEALGIRFLAKPFSNAVLLATIRSFLDP